MLDRLLRRNNEEPFRFSLNEAFRITASELDALTMPDIKRKYLTMPDIGERMPFPPNTMIAERFLLKEVIGRGGRGVVFKAKDCSEHDRYPAGRDVAVKFYFPMKKPLKYGSDYDNCRTCDSKNNDIRDFFHGVRNGRKLSGGSFVEIIASGTYGKFPYVATEFIKGRNLGELVRNSFRGLQPAFVMKISVQACYALQQMHNAGIIHRDIKPDNLMLTAKGEVKVVDFDYFWTNEFGSRKKSAKNTIYGSLGYLRPEEIKGERLSKRGDIYCLGLTIYELLTRERFHKGKTVSDIVESHARHEALKILPNRNRIPEKFEAIILKAISINPRDRYATAAEMRLAIEEVIKEEAMVKAKQVPLRQRLLYLILPSRKKTSNTFS